ncbi:hypothetical protein [Streptomyces apocyni]|uniref:hypothetical protein n=1 Tax=Streptomyces apocyni TaxID=2654677 RepID=UPI0012EA82CB|nr:hypothetical protein [Streptomyces apocyni]
MLASVPVRPLARLLAAVLTAVAVLVMVCASAVAASARQDVDLDPAMAGEARAAAPAVLAPAVPALDEQAAPQAASQAALQAAPQGERVCEQCVERGHSNCDGPVRHAVRDTTPTPKPGAAVPRGPYALAGPAPEPSPIRLTGGADPRAPDLHLLQLLRV